MSVKIFLPSKLFYIKEDCDIYGEIQINENNAVSYFVVAHCKSNTTTDNTSVNSQSILTTNKLRHLGHIFRAGPLSQQQRRDVAISFAYDADTPNIYLLKLSIKPTNKTQANVFLYDVSKMMQLHEYMNFAKLNAIRTHNNGGGNGGIGESDNQCDDIRMLCRLLCENRRQLQINNRHKQSVVNILENLIFFLPNCITRAIIILLDCRHLERVMRKTFIYEHYLEWRRYRESGKRNINLALDKLVGIGVMLLLLFYITDPGDYLLATSHLVVQKLRLLLRSLKGSPIGLKLNEHLNNFLLDCFNYHIDLWAKFLDLIEPIVRQLFVPIALLGFIGLSFQLACLPILISIIGLHAHCFYIYTAVLYKVEIKGIQVLWKVMLGKRYNVLKNRVESHNYVNRQLYLATIFFTSLLFLFPTVLVYYVVFTTLRLIIYLINLFIQILRRQILEFPLQTLLKWCIGRFYDIESIYLAHMPHAPSPLLQSEPTRMRMSVFKLNIQKSPLSRAFSCESGFLKAIKTSETDQKMSIRNAFNRMLKGTF
ncbi:uncharacterized protein PIG-Q [Eurosta solidaginis]|uniref:uncharacterized protein PIG-Q n=1 Tax=Eurosta solidaginis TaxID=178769 RepID=UPI003531477F